MQTALAAGLRQYGLEPRALEVAASAWPAVQTLHVDLSGAAANRDLRPPAMDGTAGPEITVAELRLHAEPLLLEGTPLTFALQASEAVFTLGEKLLALRGARAGTLRASIARADLQKLALEVARALAKEQGGQVQDLQLALEAEGPRSLRLRVQTTAKMGFMKATLILTGRAEVDDQLRLSLSDLELKGDGFASGMAANLLRPKLEKIAARPLPLAVFALGELRLRELTLSTGEVISAEAAFAS